MTPRELGDAAQVLTEVVAGAFVLTLFLALALMPRGKGPRE